MVSEEKNIVNRNITHALGYTLFDDAVETNEGTTQYKEHICSVNMIDIRFC
jgi:hypothetical protein